MEAPRQEALLLGWEISHLTTKLREYGKLYSKTDLTTLNCLNQLIGTIDSFLKNKSLGPNAEWNADDRKIFNGYRFMHTINCRQCNQSVRTTKPGLLKHLREHDTEKEAKAAQKAKVDKEKAMKEAKEREELLKKRINKAVNDGLTKDNVEHVKKEGQVDGILSVENDEDRQSKEDLELTESEEQLEDKVSNGIEDGQKKETMEDEEKEEKMKENDEHKIEEKVQSDAQINEQKEQVEKGKAKETANKKKQNEQIKEPVRKEHVPMRRVEGSYISRGCFPKTVFELTKATKKFVSNGDGLQKRIERWMAERTELLSCPEHDRIVQNLEAIFKESFPKVKAFPFGSRTTGLGTKASDLDIFLDLQGNYWGTIAFSKEALKDMVQLAEIMLSRSNQFSKLQAVANAKTPIIRAWNVEEKIDCDISFTHGLSHRNTKLIKYFFKLQPVCYAVALYVKEWAASFHNEGLNTYTLVMLTIFYFQKFGMLPSVYDLQKDCPKPQYIMQWQANFEKKTLEELKLDLVPMDSVDKHVIKFFEFYGKKFCFETCVVCPVLGKAPLKIDLDPTNSSNFPSSLKNLQKHYSKLDPRVAHPVNDLLSYQKPMVVQDPFELSHNVAKRVGPQEINKFRQFCAQTAKLLNDLANERRG